MFYHIRPSTLFSLVGASSYYERMVRIVLPDFRTPNLLETTVLISLSKVVRAKTYFEFGSLFGIQTLNIIANLKDSAHAFTLDLDQRSFLQAQQNKHDREISRKHLSMADQSAFLNSPYRRQVTRLYGDSNKYDFTRFFGCLHMCYVDGGHDLRTVKSDTANAFKMLKPKGLSCIAWHDYANKTYRQVTDYLHQLARKYDLYHVEETMICFYLQHPLPSMTKVLQKSPK